MSCVPKNAGMFCCPELELGEMTWASEHPSVKSEVAPESLPCWTVYSDSLQCIRNFSSDMSSAAVPAFARLIIKQSCNESGLSGETRFGCVSAGWLKVRLCNLSSTTVHQCSSCQCPIAGSQHVLSFECIQLAPPTIRPLASWVHSLATWRLHHGHLSKRWHVKTTWPSPQPDDLGIRTSQREKWSCAWELALLNSLLRFLAVHSQLFFRHVFCSCASVCKTDNVLHLRPRQKSNEFSLQKKVHFDVYICIALYSYLWHLSDFFPSRRVHTHPFFSLPQILRVTAEHTVLRSRKQVGKQALLKHKNCLSCSTN